jgi:hypothetical protein
MFLYKPINSSNDKTLSFNHYDLNSKVSISSHKNNMYIMNTGSVLREKNSIMLSYYKDGKFISSFEVYEYLFGIKNSEIVACHKNKIYVAVHKF